MGSTKDHYGHYPKSFTPQPVMETCYSSQARSCKVAKVCASKGDENMNQKDESSLYKVIYFIRYGSHME